MPTIAQLNQRHPSHDEAELADLCALYEGGKKFKARLNRFLPRWEREPEDRHCLRKDLAHYRNYLGPIIDYFASMLFVSRTVSKAQQNDKLIEDPGEYWKEFREDCDGGGTDLDDMFKALLTRAMVERAGWLRLHAPTDDKPPPVSAAEFEERKLGECWLEQLEGCNVLDWDTGEDGRLLWAVVYRREQRRQGVSGDRNHVVETWEYLTPDQVETYRLEWDLKEPPKPDQEVPRIGAQPHRFGRVPLVCLDLPAALWVANRLATLQLANFRHSNAQSYSLQTSCYAMMIFGVADPEEFKKVTVGPARAIVIGKDEKAEWHAPPSAHFGALDTEIKAEKDEIFRIAHQMALGVENNAAAVGRSAESKASDAESTRVVLVAFSRIVRETIEYTLDLIAKARGEEFTWSVEGLDDFAALDATAFLENLKLLSDSGRVIPSKTFATAVNERAAELFLPHMDEQTKATVRKEIQAGTTDPAEDAKAEREEAAKLFAQRTAAPPNGTQRPGAAPPAREA